MLSVKKGLTVFGWLALLSAVLTAYLFFTANTSGQVVLSLLIAVLCLLLSAACASYRTLSYYQHYEATSVSRMKSGIRRPCGK